MCKKCHTHKHTSNRLYWLCLFLSNSKHSTEDNATKSSLPDDHSKHRWLQATHQTTWVIHKGGKCRKRKNTLFYYAIKTLYNCLALNSDHCCCPGRFNTSQKTKVKAEVNWMYFNDESLYTKFWNKNKTFNTTRFETIVQSGNFFENDSPKKLLTLSHNGWSSSDNELKSMAAKWA